MAHFTAAITYMVRAYWYRTGTLIDLNKSDSFLRHFTI